MPNYLLLTVPRALSPLKMLYTELFQTHLVYQEGWTMWNNCLALGEGCTSLGGKAVQSCGYGTGWTPSAEELGFLFISATGTLCNFGHAS